MEDALTPHRAQAAGTTRPETARAAGRDIAVVILAILLAGGLSVRFELSEQLARRTVAGEHYQLDELPGILLFSAVALLWFARRRQRETRIALEERRLVQIELARSLEENRRLAHRTLAAQEAERKHLARELHDELGQYLNAIKIDAVALEHADPPPAGRQADAVTGILRNADHVYRVINSLIRRLRPAGLDDIGLAAALESCVDDWRARVPDTRLDLRIDGDLSHLDETLTLTVYRMVQEGLTNVARHAGASEVVIAIACGKQAVDVRLQDNGRGNGGARGVDRRRPEDRHGPGLGLVGMRERVQALGGRFVAERLPANHDAAGGGFRLTARLPLPTAPQEPAGGLS